MELELGLKITKAVDDISSANLEISKDRGTLFLSRETDTMFILTAHLNGYRRENINVDINEDGTKMTIRCEKAVQEMIMVGWKVVKKELEMRGIEKSFKIPNGIVLDKIKAKFKDNGSILTISIPKIEKGRISGNGLEEFKEDEVLEGDSQSSKVTNEAIEKAITMQENQEYEAEVVKENETTVQIEEVQEKRVSDPKEEKENQEVEKKFKEDEVLEGDSQSSKVIHEVIEKATTLQENQESEAEEVKENENETIEPIEDVQEKRVCDPKEEKEKQEVEKESRVEFGDGKTDQEQLTEYKECEKPSLVEENSPIDENPQVEKANTEAKNKESEKPSLVEEHRPIDENLQVEKANTEAKNEMEEENVSDNKEEAKNEMKENVSEHKEEAKTKMEKENVSEHREYDKPETSCANQDTDHVQENEDGCVNNNKFVANNIHDDDSFPRVEENSPREKSKLCIPIVVGSTLIVSFFVFVFHFIRSKNQASRRSN